MDTATFPLTAFALTGLVGLLVGAVLGAALTLLRHRGRVAAGTEAAEARLAADQAVLREGLERLHDQMRDLDHQRASWQGQLRQQVEDMRFSTEALRRETQSLSTALRKPQVRGRWGELHLRRTVELAGLVEHCDFSEQVQVDDGARRPDLVVHLAGGRQVIVDAKVPLDAYLDATSAEDDDAREHHLGRHAQQVRTHVDLLSSKQYWRSLTESPEFVVLFVPAESCLAAALQHDAALIEYAAKRQVVLATPTTLIALLRTVAHGWNHEALAEQARDILRLGRDLHARLKNFAGHLDQVGRSLDRAVGHFNHAIGSLDSRVLVAARRFQELSVTEEDLPTPQQVESATRSLAGSVTGAEVHPLERRARPEEEADEPTVAM